MKKFILLYLFSLIAFVILIFNYGKYIDSLTVIYIVISFAISMLLFVLRLKEKAKKLYKIITIFVTGISLVLITLFCDYFGSVFNSYNYITAQKDILSGKIQFVHYGNFIIVNDTGVMIQYFVEEYYGYSNIIADSWASDEVEAITEKCYNQQMNKYLEKKYGVNWKEDASQLYKSLFKIVRDSALTEIQKDSLMSLKLKRKKKTTAANMRSYFSRQRSSI